MGSETTHSVPNPAPWRETSRSVPGGVLDRTHQSEADAEAFGGPRVDPATIKPGPKATVGELRCFAVTRHSGFGAHTVVTWSDGAIETLDSPGTYPVTTKAVATGSRGSRLDVDVCGGSACGSPANPGSDAAFTPHRTAAPANMSLGIRRREVRHVAR